MFASVCTIDDARSRIVDPNHHRWCVVPSRIDPVLEQLNDIDGRVFGWTNDFGSRGLARNTQPRVAPSVGGRARVCFQGLSGGRDTAIENFPLPITTCQVAVLLPMVGPIFCRQKHDDEHGAIVAEVAHPEQTRLPPNVAIHRPDQLPAGMFRIVVVTKD